MNVRWCNHTVSHALMLAPVLALIRFYQRRVSLFIRSRKCRFFPTCSEYAYEAIEKHGLISGTVLAYRRYRRCNPDHSGGDDPVP